MMITKTRGLILAPTFWVVATAAAGASQPPAIRHEPLRCVQATGFPRVDAGISAAAGVQRTRVYFKAHQHPDWYYVEMRALQASRYLALLPQPLPETEQLDYYVHAVDSAVQMTQTNTFGPEVSRGPCRLGRAVPLWKWPVAIVIGATKAGQAAIPPGFSPAGITAFVTQAGVTVTGAALTSGGTSGVGTTAGANAQATGGTSTTAGAGTQPTAATASAGTTGAPSAAGTAAGSGTGTAATTGTAAVAAGKAGGGLSATALVVGGVAVVGGGAAAILAGKGGGSGPVGGSGSGGSNGPGTGGTGGGGSGAGTPVVTLGAVPASPALLGVTQVQLTATVTGLDAASLRYAWDFGDGTQSTDARPVHVFTQKGNPGVGLTVRDGQGRSASASLAFEVKAFDGRWEYYPGVHPDYQDCVQTGAAVACVNSGVDPLDTLESAVRVSGVLGDPRSFSTTWTFEFGSVRTCSGSLDAPLNFYECNSPEGYYFHLRRVP